MLTLIHNNKEHNEVSALLPWYVNQTLSDSEQQTVEKHIGDCKVCQQEITLLKATFESANDFDAAVIPSDTQFDSIMQRIERTDASHAGADIKSSTKPATSNWHQHPRMAMAASFLGAMLILYWASPLFLGEHTTEKENKPYEALSSLGAPVEIEIVFENDTIKEDALNIVAAIDSNLTLNSSPPQYRFNVPEDYDFDKTIELVNQLKSKNQIANVKIVRED